MHLFKLFNRKHHFWGSRNFIVWLFLIGFISCNGGIDSKEINLPHSPSKNKIENFEIVKEQFLASIAGDRFLDTLNAVAG